MSTQELCRLIAKRIESVNVAANIQAAPRDQPVLVFGDQTNFEIYGDQIGWSSPVYEGGRDAATKSVGRAGGTVTKIRRVSGGGLTGWLRKVQDVIQEDDHA